VFPVEHQASIDWLREVILPWANFAIFFGAAIFFFRKMVVGAAAKKRAEFETLMAEAKAAKAQAQEKLAEIERREANLSQELAKMAALSKSSSEAETAKIISDAGRLAEHLRTEAKRIADAEVDKARAAMRQEIVAAVRDAVAKRMTTELDAGAQQEIVRKRIADLKSIRVEG
jgi:F0F1-type ATP synthase membrane subunit b/b'